MADSDGADKTEEATPQRREQAREDGQIVTSKDMFVLVTVAGGLGLLILLRGALPGLAARWGDYFAVRPGADLDALMLTALGRAWGDILLAGLVCAVPLLVLVLLVQFAMGGLNFSAKALEFKGARIDPLAGLARLVSVKALVELGKAVVKVVLLGGVAVLVFRDQLAALTGLSTATPAAAATALGTALVGLMWALVLALAVIGALDLVWQMHSLNKGLRMTKDELKREAKESNGSPEVKGRQRRLQMEASRRGAQQRGALKDVPLATTIITNPTHFAVALRYAPGDAAAPVILAMGKDRIAQEIVARGTAAGIGILEIPALARALYFTGHIGGQIDEQLYGAVAAVLAHVYRLNRGEAGPRPDITLPDGLLFDTHGRPQKGRPA